MRGDRGGAMQTRRIPVHAKLARSDRLSELSFDNALLRFAIVVSSAGPGPIFTDLGPVSSRRLSQGEEA
jgi:hypothetical protein